MAVIQERTTQSGEKRYLATIRLKGHPTQSATFSRRNDAKKWIQTTEANIREGRYLHSSQERKKTVLDVIERYERDILPHRTKDKDKMQRLLNWWKREMGSYILTNVHPSLLSEMRDKLKSQVPPRRKKPRSASTVIHYMVALSNAFNFAVKEWGWMRENPMLKVAKPKLNNQRERVLSDKELKALLKAAAGSPNSYIHLIVLLAITSGARFGEIINLTWNDVDIKNRRLFLRKTKNGDQRTVPLIEETRAIIVAMSKVRRIDTTLLFPREDGKAPQEIRKAWLNVLDEAGIKNFRFHDLRHTCATYLAENGATLIEIASILGHRTLQMVKRYSHITDKHNAALIQKMSKRVLG